MMKYGHFDDAAREYVITRPNTPRSWSNYLGSRTYGGIITNQAGGYSFTRSPAEGRFLRHRYNSVPMDQPGRLFYIRDQADGDFWSAAWQPVAKPLDQYATTCRMGTSYAEITSEYRDIRTVATYFVPLEQSFEYWWLRVENTGTTPRRLSIFSFAEFTSEWNLINDLLNLQYTMYIAEARFDDGLIHASSCGRLPEDEGNFANRDQSRHWWMTQVGGELKGYDLEREAFTGPYNGYDKPEVLQRGACGNSEGFSDNLCGAMQSDIVLAPGESTDVLVLLGIGRGETIGKKTRQTFGTVERAAQELEKLKAYWHRMLDRLQVKTPDPDFDHMINVWNAYGALLTFEWSRSCSLVYTGEHRDGFGFRDTVQDILGVVPLLPDVSRERLLLMLSGQDASGGAQPEIRPWSHRPGQMPPTPESHYRSDDCLWFFNTIPVYVAETGEDTFYDEVVPFADHGEATVLGHLRRALEFNLARTGRNGLPCGLLADWNDCLKLGHHGESVFVTFQLRLGLVTYMEISEARGHTEEAEWARGQLRVLDERIQKVTWDDEWFIWAIGEDGTVYGTKDAEEGRIYLNTQCWAILSGAATEAQRDSALAAVKEQLATKYGVAICAPPIGKMPVEVMRAVLMNPGNKENAGIFSHTQSWIVLAEIARGNGDQAYEYYRAYMPSAQNDIADIRQIEPYAHNQSTHSQFSKKFGTSRVPWLSGTVSWSYYTATNHILGIRPERDGLTIDPCISSTWEGYSMRRLFRDKMIEIEVRNPNGLQKGVRRLTVDGKAIEGNWVAAEVLCDGSRIEVTLEG